MNTSHYILRLREGAKMQRNIAPASVLRTAPLLLAAATAVADNGVAITITNDTTEDIVVTVYDNTVGPDAVVLSHSRINGFTRVPVSVSSDASGRANLSWTAVSARSTERKCGHQNGVQLGDSASLAVYADSLCASP